MFEDRVVAEPALAARRDDPTGDDPLEELDGEGTLAVSAVVDLVVRGRAGPLVGVLVLAAAVAAPAGRRSFVRLR